MAWQRWKNIRDHPTYRMFVEKVIEFILPQDIFTAMHQGRLIPGFPRPRVDPTIVSPFPGPYPAPSVVADAWEKRKPINDLLLNLPDGTTIPIIPLLRMPLITPGTWTDNNPSAGYVSWSGCQVAHEGEIYTIAGGNTNKKYIYWDKSVSVTAFQTSDSKPTLDPREDLLICFNDSGTARLALLSNLIQADWIIAGTLEGITGIFGDGNVVLDENGISIQTDAPGFVGYVKWLDTAGIRRVHIGGTGTASQQDATLFLAVLQASGAAAGGLTLQQIPENPSWSRLYLSQTDLRLVSVDSWLEFIDSNTKLRKDDSGNLCFEDAMAGEHILRRLKGAEFKDEPARALNLTGQSDVDWTDLDLTAHTSANARGVILTLNVRDSGGANGWLQVRKNGTTGTYAPLVATQVANVWNPLVVAIPCDSGQVIEYKIDATGAGTADVIIDVLGYWE